MGWAARTLFWLPIDFDFCLLLPPPFFFLFRLLRVGGGEGMLCCIVEVNNAGPAKGMAAD